MPLIIVAVMLTNLPAPQLTYGEMFEPLQRSETIAGIAPSAPGELATALPTEQPRPSAKPFLQAFGAIDRTDFLTLFLCLTLGTAALPSLLARSGVTSSVGEQRRSVAWGAFFVALFAISAPALAAFVKLLMFQDIAQSPAQRAAGLAQRAHRAPSALRPRRQCRRRHRGRQSSSSRATVSCWRCRWRRGCLTCCTVLMAAAGMAIALAAAASHLFTLAGSLADDVSA